MIDPVVPSPRARAALLAFVLAMLVGHGVVAYLSPLVGDDWRHYLWAARHAGKGPLKFVASHRTLPEMIGYALAHSRLFHAIATPLASLALILGLFTIAARRLPRIDAWDDVVGVIVLSALVWIGNPKCGLVYFYRAYAAAWVYCGAATLWLLVPLRCGWRLPAPIAVIGGFLLGMSTRQLGTIALGLAIYERKHRLLIGALAVGTVLGYALPPYVDFRGWKPGFEASLVAFNVAIKEGGELISLVAGLALVKLVLGALRPRWAGEPVPVVSESLRLGALWLLASALALCGPRYTDATLLPATLVLCVGAWPYVVWLQSSPPLRVALVTLAIAIHVVVWAFALATYVPLHAEFRERIAILEAAPAGTAPTIEPYGDVDQSFWWWGEDWGDPGPRQLAAIELFGVRDIAFAPTFRRFEGSAGIAVRPELDGVTDQQLAAVHVPAYWATDVDTARRQFTGLFDDLAEAGVAASGRLVATNLPLPDLRGRPLLVTFVERGQPLKLTTRRFPPDDDDEYAISTGNAIAKAYPEAHAYVGATPVPVRFENRRYWVRPMTTELTVVIACSPTRCILVDAFVPRL
jgi:hypothetical protein